MDPLHTFGTATPLVLVPGIQGRWEWMMPAIDALEQRHRVLTFSLTEASGSHFFDQWHQRVDAAMDAACIQRTALVGVSFGGVIAAAYAARFPHRVTHLVLVSTPSPRFRLDRRASRYVRWPWLALPLFALRASGRLLPEIRSALPNWRRRAAFAAVHSFRTLRSPVSPRLMAAWAREWQALELAAAFRTITAPTLVITGEPELDRVVPVASSLDYLDLIPGARHQTLAATGHIGLLLRPDTFAAIVSDFLARPSA
jgi:pimeloyl-ACP methyl ester carboxylesterase